jgi:PPOX class probable F420-dependent enzyme
MPVEPTASRPYMPGYGTLGPDEGTGLLPWSWAIQQLTESHDYWVATIRPDGAPSVLPVWGAWMEGAVWFSSSHGSRRARNLAADPRCTVTNVDAARPVSVQGMAELVTDPEAIEAYTAVTNEKYEVDYSADFYTENALFAVRPVVVIALREADFTGSPTRWTF